MRFVPDGKVPTDPEQFRALILCILDGTRRSRPMHSRTPDKWQQHGPSAISGYEMPIFCEDRTRRRWQQKANGNYRMTASALKISTCHFGIKPSIYAAQLGRSL